MAYLKGDCDVISVDDQGVKRDLTVNAVVKDVEKATSQPVGAEEERVQLNKAALPAESKHPVILFKAMHVSTLILHHFHNQLGHAGRNHMLSRLRQKYWITNANSAARRVISDCILCRRNRGKLIEQKMADLPEERVLPEKAPFTNVGINYFGPIDFKRCRSLLKRYGVLFTCLTSRAVHLEVACTLDTDSCINAIRRFICRQGPVSAIRSDNGTNFVGANRELKDVWLL